MMKKLFETKGISNDKPLICCRDVSLAYEGRVVASGVNLTVSCGDYLCIVGENGSGKSTLMKAMLGLHPVEKGTIEASPEAVTAGFGYLPQQTPAQRDFPASVWEVVTSGCLGRGKWRPFLTAADKKRARDAMRRMGISDLEKKCYRDLSGGQQQRVLLARAFCATGKLIFLDEPIAGLDPLAMQDMYDVISEMHCPEEGEGVTVVMVSHDVAAAVRYATHILHMDKTDAFFGRTEDYLKTELGRRFVCERCAPRDRFYIGEKIPFFGDREDA